MPRAANRSLTSAAAAAPSRFCTVRVRRLRRGRERGVRGVGELRLDQRGVPGLRAEAELLVAEPDLPQRLAPDLAVVVHLARLVLHGQVAVEAADAVRRVGVRRGVPVHRAGGLGLPRPAVLLVGGEPDRDPEVVAPRLADRAGLLAAAEAGHLGGVDRVAVLVDDHLGVLGVVDAALAEPHPVGLVGLVGVVAAVLVDLHRERLLHDPAQRGAEAEGLEVLLGLVDPEVAHHLLELVLVAVVDGTCWWCCTPASPVLDSTVAHLPWR